MKNKIKYAGFYFFLLSVLFLLNGCEKKEEKIILGSIEINIDKNWQFRQAGKDNWAEATVPGCVHTDLLKNNIIKDPFKRDYEKKLQWIEREDWEYKTNFYVPFKMLDFDHVNLNFEGLDTYANVYLNDSLLLQANNMFVGWQTDCKKYLKPGENSLRVYFFSPVNKVLKSTFRLPVLFDQSKLKSAPLTRKAAFHYGYDFSPRFVTSGIWRPVKLSAWNTAKINHIRIIQHQITNANANLSAVFEIESEKNIAAVIWIKNKENLIKNFRKKILLKKGKNNVPLDFIIAKPRRWWPNGMGEPFLYNIIGELKINNMVADSLTVRTGLRTIQVLTKKDSTGEGFSFKVNDKAVYIKGAIAVPSDVFLARAPEEKYKNIIVSARGLNINLLRVFSAGVYESGYFYELCDENGIMVWQDFMFGNALYPPNSLFNKNIEKEINYNVVRLRNHASLAMYCGNENIENAWYNSVFQNSLYFKGGDSLAAWENYINTFHRALPAIVHKLDDKYYLFSSPKYPFPKNKIAGDFHAGSPGGLKNQALPGL